MLMMSDFDLFKYKPDGIYIKISKFVYKNLSFYYKEQPNECIDYLDNLLDNDDLSYKAKYTIKQVQDDLINNYYSL